VSSKTKIVVLHLKEVIYTAIFAGLGVLLVILLCWMFQERDSSNELQETIYVPGVYSTSFQMNDSTIAVEVIVDENHINDISFVNLEESVTVMYPLMEPAMDDIRTQIYESQSLENITYEANNQYTTEVLVMAIDDALEQARVEKTE
jgi:uncharacterized protein with FMN-binding domain